MKILPLDLVQSNKFKGKVLQTCHDFELNQNVNGVV